MPKLATPQNVRLSDEVEGRKATKLCIEFDPVMDAEEYFVWVNNVEWPTPIASGSWIDPLDANTDYSLQVQARASGFVSSDLSAAYLTVTRPPVPNAPLRLPYDLQGWGIVTHWSKMGGWPGAGSELVRLFRRESGGSWVLLKETAAPKDTFVDTGYTFNVIKEYSLQLVTPSTLLGPNESELGPVTSAVGPFGVSPVGGLPSRIEMARTASQHVARKLMGLRFFPR